jgi:hypothetical protein
VLLALDEDTMDMEAAMTAGQHSLPWRPTGAGTNAAAAGTGPFLDSVGESQQGHPSAQIPGDLEGGEAHETVIKAEGPRLRLGVGASGITDPWAQAGAADAGAVVCATRATGEGRGLLQHEVMSLLSALEIAASAEDAAMQGETMPTGADVYNAIDQVAAVHDRVAVHDSTAVQDDTVHDGDAVNHSAAVHDCAAAAEDTEASGLNLQKAIAKAGQPMRPSADTLATTEAQAAAGVVAEEMLAEADVNAAVGGPRKEELGGVAEADSNAADTSSTEGEATPSATAADIEGGEGETELGVWPAEKGWLSVASLGEEEGEVADAAAMTKVSATKHASDMVVVPESQAAAAEVGYNTDDGASGYNSEAGAADWQGEFMGGPETQAIAGQAPAPHACTAGTAQRKAAPEVGESGAGTSDAAVAGETAGGVLTVEVEEGVSSLSEAWGTVATVKHGTAEAVETAIDDAVQERQEDATTTGRTAAAAAAAALEGEIAVEEAEVAVRESFAEVEAQVVQERQEEATPAGAAAPGGETEGTTVPSGIAVAEARAAPAQETCKGVAKTVTAAAGGVMGETQAATGVAIAATEAAAAHEGTPGITPAATAAAAAAKAALGVAGADTDKQAAAAADGGSGCEETSSKATAAKVEDATRLIGTTGRANADVASAASVLTHQQIDIGSITAAATTLIRESTATAPSSATTLIPKCTAKAPTSATAGCTGAAAAATSPAANPRPAVKAGVAAAVASVAAAAAAKLGQYIPATSDFVAGTDAMKLAGTAGAGAGSLKAATGGAVSSAATAGAAGGNGLFEKLELGQHLAATAASAFAAGGGDDGALNAVLGEGQNVARAPVQEGWHGVGWHSALEAPVNVTGDTPVEVPAGESQSYLASISGIGGGW